QEPGRRSRGAFPVVPWRPASADAHGPASRVRAAAHESAVAAAGSRHRARPRHRCLARVDLVGARRPRQVLEAHLRMNMRRPAIALSIALAGAALAADDPAKLKDLTAVIA